MQKQQRGGFDGDSRRDPGSAVQKSGEPGDTTTMVPPVVAGKAVKEWSFTELRGDVLDEVEVGSGIQVGGLLNEIHDYGPTFRDSDVFFPDETSRPSPSPRRRTSSRSTSSSTSPGVRLSTGMRRTGAATPGAPTIPSAGYGQSRTSIS